MEEIFDTHSPILETIMGNLMNHLTQTQMLEILKSVVCDKAKKALEVNANTYINELDILTPTMFNTEEFHMALLRNNIQEKSFYQAVAVILGFLLQRLLKENSNTEILKQKSFFDTELFDLLKKRSL